MLEKKLTQKEISKLTKTVTVCKGVGIYVDNKGYMYVIENNNLIYTTKEDKNK